MSTVPSRQRRILICGESYSSHPYLMSLQSLYLLGDIVWAHEDVKQLFDGLADVVVRSLPLPRAVQVHINTFSRSWILRAAPISLQV